MLTCMLNCSVSHHVQQVTRIVEAAAVEVDSRCTAHEQIVFLRDKVVKGEERTVMTAVIKRIHIVINAAAINVVHDRIANKRTYKHHKPLQWRDALADLA